MHLRFNDKTKILRIYKEEDKKELLALIKKVSGDYPEPESDSKLTVPEKVDEIIVLIEKIKNKNVPEIYEDFNKADSETLKDIFVKKVGELLTKKSNVKRLEDAFKGFNFNLFRLYPQTLVPIVTNAPNACVRFEKFLLNKTNLSTFDRGLIINYLCQTSFKKKKLIEKLKEDDQIEPIIERFKTSVVVNNKDNGYCGIEFKVVS